MLTSLLQLDFGLALCNVIIQDNLIDFIAETSLLAIMLIIVVFRRPFVEWYKNIGLAVILLACIVSNVSQYLLATSSVSAILSYAMLILLCVYLLGLVILVVVYGCIARCCRLPACCTYVLLSLSVCTCIRRLTVDITN